MSLCEDGFELFRGVFAHDEMVRVIAELPSLESAGSRRMLDTEVGRRFANDSRIRNVVETDLGESARPVRAILFDKTGEKNWTLGLHQDTKIAINERQDVEGFTNWSNKEGIPHCQPPIEFLEQSVAVRIHLDACPIERGSLMVVPGSHKFGLIIPTDESEKHTMAVPCDQGDVILMKPLTLHGSKAATEPGHRRVLHIEFCGLELPHPLEWAY